MAYIHGKEGFLHPKDFVVDYFKLFKENCNLSIHRRLTFEIDGVIHELASKKRKLGMVLVCNTYYSLL